MSEVDKFPVKDLPSRYDVGRTALYARFTAALVIPEKDGVRSYISGKDLEELDRLDSHIKTGGKLEDFKPASQSSAITQQPAAIEAVTATTTNQDRENFLELIEAIARHIAATRDPLQHYASLERAIASAWLLSSSEVRSLIGVAPKGDRYQRGSFVFIRNGKIGAQSAWRVVKVVSGGVYKV